MRTVVSIARTIALTSLGLTIFVQPLTALGLSACRDFFRSQNSAFSIGGETLDERMRAIHRLAQNADLSAQLAVDSVPGLFRMQRTPFLPVPWLGRATAIDEEAAVRRAQAMLDRLSSAPRSQARLQSAVASRDRVFVAVHQHSTLQGRTYVILNSSRFRGIESAFLVSERYPLRDLRVARMASQLIYSYGGELSRPLVARHVYLAGGYCSACLSLAAAHLIQQASELQMPELGLHVIEPITYVTGPGAIPISLSTGANLASVRRIRSEWFSSTTRFAPERIAYEAGPTPEEFDVLAIGGRAIRPLRVRVTFEAE